ncbi:MAG TPA: glutathione S-transferase N-terminal domain-containing protein, partial [Reyranella sp.]
VKADVKSLPFPPRRLQPDYLSVNPAGTVPAMVDGDRVMTESLAICEVLVARHGNTSLVVAPGDPERAPFLQWLWYGESTIMLPIGMMSRVERLKVPGPATDAILEMARQILRIEGKTDYARGITCNVGLIKVVRASTSSRRNARPRSICACPASSSPRR